MRSVLTAILLIFPSLIFSQKVNESYIQAIANIQQKKYAIAIDELTRLIESDDDEASYYLQRGNAYYGSGFYENAKKDFIQANTIKPTIASFELAKTHAKLHETELMLKTLENHLNSRYKKDRAEIISDEAFIEYEREKSWEDFWKNNWYNRRELLVDEIEYNLKYKDFNEALLKADEAVKKSRKNHRALVLRGEALAELGNHPRAIKDYSRAIKLNKRKEQYYILRAKSYIETENYKDAGHDLEYALSLNPTNFEYYKLLAEVYALDQNIEKAEENLYYYLTFFDEDLEASFLFGKIYLNANQPLKALPYLNKCIESDKTNPDYFTQRANAYLETKTYPYAIKDYSMALDLNPYNAEAYLNKGIARQKSGDLKGACSDWKKANKLGSKKALEFLIDYCQ